ncbi:MAG TPA: PBS lyase [Sediminispirochaeta sp.]|nr:PBS lyase [Sediminispirochaeta sp.]
MRVASKKNIIVVLLGLLALPLWGADESTAVWTRLYERARSYPQKQQIMMNIVEQHNREMIPVLTEALQEELDNFSNVSGVTERSMQSELMRTIVKELGLLKAVPARNLVMRTVEVSDDSILQAEAVMALGRMGARDYAEPLAMMLRNINFNLEGPQRQRENETLAYALVFALGRLKQAVGYEPVFFASRAWYSSRSGVKELAEEVLTTMVEDPSEGLLRIVVENDEYANKLAALQALERSEAPEEAKARGAAAGLNEGLKYTAGNISEGQVLKSLRLYSLGMLEKYPMPEYPELIPQMKRMIRLYSADRVYDEDEMITLMEAMGSFTGEEEAARVLADFLAYYNYRRETSAPDSYRIVRALIQALGNIGHPAATEELTVVTMSEYWESSIQREAENALRKIR